MDSAARDDVVLTLTESDDVTTREQGRRRRIALCCHFGVRSAALAFYLFCTWFTAAFIAPVVMIFCLFAIDFWLVKNVSGRLLVGLRWWNSIDGGTGASSWIFESSSASKTPENEVPLSRREQSARKSASRLFWIGLLVFPLLWALLTLVAIFSLKLAWSLVALSGLLATGVNAYGYLRCRFRGTPIIGEGASFKEMLTGTVAKSVLNELWSGGVKDDNTENTQLQRRQDAAGGSSMV